MTNEPEPYGAQLLAELRNLQRLDLLTRKFDYEAIQALKQADRSVTLKLFQGSSYAFLQLIKTQSPAQVAQAMIQAQKDGEPAAMIIMMSIIH